jgi:hypothetical protein
MASEKTLEQILDYLNDTNDFGLSEEQKDGIVEKFRELWKVWSEAVDEALFNWFDENPDSIRAGETLSDPDLEFFLTLEGAGTGHWDKYPDQFVDEETFDDFGFFMQDTLSEAHREFNLKMEDLAFSVSDFDFEN